MEACRACTTEIGSQKGTKPMEKNVREPQSRVGRALLNFNTQAKLRTGAREFVAKFIMTGADAQSTTAQVAERAAARQETGDGVCFN